MASLASFCRAKHLQFRGQVVPIHCCRWVTQVAVTVWGEVGRFDAQRPSVNWFNNSANSPEGFYLERLFPQGSCRAA